MAQRNYKNKTRAHFSLGFFSFLRGGGTGASAPLAAPASFFTFLTIFFLGASFGGSVGVAGSLLSETEDSIWAAVVGLAFGALTPICSSETAPTGGVGTSGSSTESRLSCAGRGGEGWAAGSGAVTVGVRNSLAMMDCASEAASSSSLSGVGRGSATAGGLSSNFPTGLRRSSATQPIPSFSRSIRCGVSMAVTLESKLG